MVELGGDVRGLMAQARRAAQKRGQPLCTGHVLWAMLQSREAGRLLGAHGLREVPLLQVLGGSPTEASNAVDLSLSRSCRLAEQSGARQAHPLHLLLAVLRDGRNVANHCLLALAIDAAPLRQVLEDSLGTPPAARSRAAVDADRALEQATRERAVGGEQAGRSADAARTRPAASRSLPPTLMDWEAKRRAAGTPPRAIPNGPRAALLTRGPAARGEVDDAAGEGVEPDTATRATGVSPGATAASDVLHGPQTPPVSPERYELDAARFPLLSALGRNLTALAAKGELDPVIGRDEEVEAILDIVARRRANNPILVGPPGVGKTAVAEGVALRLVHSSAVALSDRVLIEISAGGLVSGTGVRGALAERLAKLRSEVKQSEGRVLLFLDEIHALVGAGEGPDDIANELKAALARGELPCIGATTDAEYRRVFERDSALARRFSRVEVAEPSKNDALAILRGVSRRYEVFHCVAYSPEALSAAVELSARYMPEQQLPDKAIGLIDLAAARARRRGANTVDRSAIAAVVSDQTGVPLDRLTMRDGERLLALESLIEKRVVGQRHAIERIAEALRKGAVGLRGKRPLGVFLLLGPTGVGKTELAKALTEELFPASGMTRLDMSEYSEPHAVARLFGAPPGYVGHEDGGQLTEAVRRRPYQLILLDEAEKAHPEVLQSLLPLLDEGRLTDGRGRTIDFTNTVIVLTSNLGARAATTSEKRIGFGGASAEQPDERRAGEAKALSAVRAALPPELFNRLDEVLYCAPLGRQEVLEIARRMLDGVAATLAAEQSLTVEYDGSVLEALVAAGGYDRALGARPMRRTVGRLVESLLASALLGGSLGRGDRVRLFGEGDRIDLRVMSSEAKTLAS